MAASIGMVTKQLPVVPSKQATADISGHHTEIVVSKFEDYLFIIATQYMKIGTLIQITRDVVSDEFEENVPLFSTYVLMGKDEPITHVMARTIVTALNPPIPVILSLALKDTSVDTVQAIIELIKTCL
ncbi:proteasome assembly chaperone 3-like [Physella acuta]|uniref:proteasome assembly chaperone 3-like n=1 Tax=Physella acuta TaxID=109671 RepID=UPI0027DB8842|nr:proteasome assembly chaperone 3-like [Physella acuta]